MLERMKRMIKKLIDWFMNQCETEYILAYVLAAFIGIGYAIMIWEIQDKIAAIPSDYEKFEEQVQSIQENPDLLMEIVCQIKVDTEVITVEFENDECKMIAEYDKDFKLLSTCKEDKSIFWLEAFVVALLQGLTVGYFTWCCLMVMTFFIGKAVALFIKWSKK